MALRRRVLEEQGTCGDDEAYCSPQPKPPSPPAPASPPAAVVRPSAISPPPILSPPATKIQISNKNHLLAPVVVVVTSVLAACLLIVAFYATHRYWSSRRRRRATIALAAAWGPPQPPNDAEGDLLREDLLVGGGGGGEEPNHVWYIRTVGLDQAVIGAITVCEYWKGEGLVEGTDCAVCLGEFGEGELLRLLPKCSHAFHVPCIDTWLRSHVNCPLCRAPVVGPALARTPPPLPPPAVEGGNLGAEVVVVPPSNRQDTAGEDSSVAEDSGRRMASGDGSAEDGGNSTNLQPGHVGVDRPAAGASFSSEESETWVSIDLGSGGLGDETDRCADAAAPPEEGGGNGALQPVRRSVSMDSPAMLGLLLRTRLAGSSRDGGRKPGVTNKKGGKGEGNNCKGGGWSMRRRRRRRCWRWRGSSCQEPVAASSRCDPWWFPARFWEELPRPSEQ